MQLLKYTPLFSKTGLLNRDRLAHKADGQSVYLIVTVDEMYFYCDSWIVFPLYESGM